MKLDPDIHVDEIRKLINKEINQKFLFINNKRNPLNIMEEPNLTIGDVYSYSDMGLQINIRVENPPYRVLKYDDLSNDNPIDLGIIFIDLYGSVQDVRNKISSSIYQLNFVFIKNSWDEEINIEKEPFMKPLDIITNNIIKIKSTETNKLKYFLSNEDDMII